MAAHHIIGVVGNPNCGKTTLFNALTGARQHVGNWPGVTVERKTGDFSHGGRAFQLVDLPGTYSLEVSEEGVSLDEQVARDYVAGREADLIVNIVDASNIERNLYLTSQLIEMRVPMIVALNMMDVAKSRGVSIDTEALSRRLGCPVVPLVAASGKGVGELKDRILLAVDNQPIPDVDVTYADEVECAVGELTAVVADVARRRNCDVRWLALRLLEDDTLARDIAGKAAVETADVQKIALEEALGDDIDIVTADGRYDFVNQIIRNTVTKTAQVRRSTSDGIDRVVLNRWVGIPIFLLVMYTMFMFTINIGSAFVDFFDQLAGTLLVDGVGFAMSQWELPDWMVVLVANGIGGGLQVVATFIPIIGFLYLFLSMLEDSGYMARAAFVMDRFMRLVGLPGKSFVPMLVGFGCNVPAIMATRTLESQRDRLLTNIMNPFMSCGARLPVYALFAAAFFPVGGQNLVFGLYLTGIGVAVLTGLIMKNTLFKGESAPFVMELPAYHLPTIRGVLIRTWDRLKTFLFRAGKVIVPMVLVLNFLNALGSDGTFGHENTDKSVLSRIGRQIAPAFAPMGLDEENWPATVGIFTGVLAKEAVVGTLDALYSQMAEDSGSADENVAQTESFNLAAGITAALETIPENLALVAERVLDPLGLNIGDVSDMALAAQEQEVIIGTFSAMQDRFDGQAGAFAYLLFILLYTPCVAATAAIFRESGKGWAVFVVCWTTGIAYMAGTLFYQGATFSRHPAQSVSWIAGMLLGFGAVIVGMRLIGKRRVRVRHSLAADSL